MTDDDKSPVNVIQPELHPLGNSPGPAAGEALGSALSLVELSLTRSALSHASAVGETRMKRLGRPTGWY
jgi:hypothetical protein